MRWSPADQWGSGGVAEDVRHLGEVAALVPQPQGGPEAADRLPVVAETQVGVARAVPGGALAIAAPQGLGPADRVTELPAQTQGPAEVAEGVVEAALPGPDAAQVAGGAGPADGVTRAAGCPEGHLVGVNPVLPVPGEVEEARRSSAGSSSPVGSAA